MHNTLKYISIILLTAAVSSSVMAQNVDPYAEAILKQLKQQYDAFEGMHADFDLIIEIPEEDAQIQSGQYYQSGEKYRVNMDEHHIISDGSSLWFYIKERNEVQINNAEDMEDSEDFITPKDMFSFYESNEYDYALTNEKQEKGKTVQQIEFKPLDEDSDYFKMRLTVDKKDQAVKRLKVFAKDGTKFTLKLKELSGESVDDKLFTFDKSKYPGIHEEDLRID